MKLFYIPADFSHLISTSDLKVIHDSFDTLQKIIDGYGLADFEIGEDLDRELRRQSLSYLTVTDAAATARSIVDGIDNVLDAIKAIAEGNTRRAYEQGSGTLPYETNDVQSPTLSKATEGVIKAALDSFDIIVNFRKLQTTASLRLNLLTALEKAWLQRSIMLRTIVDREIEFHMSPDARADAGRQALARERQKP